MSFDIKDFKVDRNIPVPMYYQIEKFFMDKIRDGSIEAGECIPPELELMEAFGVSRATVRQAINNLVMQDVLVREKGRGTFVKKPKVQGTSLQMLESFQEEMSKKGYKPRTQVLELSVVQGNDEVNQKLRLSPDSKLIYLRRRRFVDDMPVLYFETYLPYDRFAGLEKEDLEKNSLYTLLETKYGCRVDKVVRRIETQNATSEAANMLKIKKHSAIFAVSFTGYSSDEPVEYSSTIYRGDTMEFVVEVQR